MMISQSQIFETSRRRLHRALGRPARHAVCLHATEAPETPLPSCLPRRADLVAEPSACMKPKRTTLAVSLRTEYCRLAPFSFSELLERRHHECTIADQDTCSGALLQLKGAR
eukprot:scaffold114_cov361-Pinguiococcus_pyrenoidosus.AAC.44